MIRISSKQVIGNFALNPFLGKFFRPKPLGSVLSLPGLGQRPAQSITTVL